ncbi:hypothetical protein H310_14752 [Aphanomyces invadans]|uniref:Major facilitator superfamily (MFS) profile domain-containing protein n=1 Tax=Aphanomyces invadans TaxID=157072 RepID=A0A024T8X7_9STRA|nr:hypothetical protein H310_14752 [Aphanomyces invadans]ETV90473.1 hypothetical protein H310_14752 [Aphanomyces invadans]|eukprot:XP_008880901.1 hypothetical protein H310_14752 [Aphanomyces invadans]
MGLCSYWTVAVPKKSPAEAMAEKWLFVLPMGSNFFARFDCIRFHRAWLCLACCLVQFCAGSIYSFTLVADDLDMFFSGTKTKQCMQALLLAYVCLGATAALSGPFLERNGPRIGMTIGTVMVALGHIFAQAGVMRKDLKWLMVAYGVCVGIGFGLLLITSISTVQKWFPDLRGSVTGLAVIFFGIGNAVFIKAFSTFVAHNAVPRLFWETGVATVVVLILCTLIIRTPPATFTVRGQDTHCVPVSRAPSPDLVQDEYLKIGMTFVNYSAVQSELDGTDGHYFQQVKALSLMQCIFSTDFVCMYIAFAACIMPIVIFIPQAQSMQGLLKIDNLTFMTYTYLANLSGRLCAPVISDLLIRVCYANPAFARKVVFVALLAIECVALFILPHHSHNATTRQWLSNALTFSSGGGLALMPCFITDMFGVYNSGSMYGLIWTSWSLGAAISWRQLDGATLTMALYEAQLHWMLILTATALGLMLFVRTNSCDRFFYGYQFSACDKILVQVPFRRHLVREDPILDSMSFTTHTPRSHDAVPTDGFVLWSGEGSTGKYVRHVVT